MELHVIIPGRAPELVVRVVDGKPVVIPPVVPAPAAGLAQPAPGR
jgi:hypothetical protein